MPPRNRNYVFTFNNYPDTVLVDTVDCKYIAYSKEIAPTTNTPHLQGYISFNSSITHAAAKRKMPGCWIQAMIGSLSENDTYINKVAQMTERGEKPMSNDNKGRAEKMRWHRARELAKEGKLDEIDADIFIRCYTTLKRIKTDYQSKPSPMDVKCYWIYGATGTGKSHAVETNFPSCYKKSMDDLKWFDGYSGESVIYLEDFDVYQVKWGGLLKRLADRWPMQASVKGGMLYIRPTHVIVTSNYHPSGIWTDENTLLPLLRRFTIIEKLSQDQEIDFSQ